MLNNTNAGYAKEAGIFGLIVGVNFISGEVTLMDDKDEQHVVAIDDVIELKQVGTLDKALVYEHDVLRANDTKKLYEVIETARGTIVLHLLNDKYEQVLGGVGAELRKEQIATLSEAVELLGSVHVLKNAIPTVDFNIAIYRTSDLQYFYAGNNKADESVDLIKVVYLGHQLIEEENYERDTYSYEAFLDLVESGELIEVSPQQLMNYVTGLMYGKKDQNVTASVVANQSVSLQNHEVAKTKNPFEIEEDDEEADCETCKGDFDSCNCKLW